MLGGMRGASSFRCGHDLGAVQTRCGDRMEIDTITQGSLGSGTGQEKASGSQRVGWGEAGFLNEVAY